MTTMFEIIAKAQAVHMDKLDIVLAKLYTRMAFKRKLHRTRLATLQNKPLQTPLPSSMEGGVLWTNNGVQLIEDVEFNEVAPFKENNNEDNDATIT